MPMTAYDKTALETLVRQERCELRKIYKYVKVKTWHVMISNNVGASLQITFEVENKAGGEHPSITTRHVAL